MIGISSENNVRVDTYTHLGSVQSTTDKQYDDLMPLQAGQHALAKWGQSWYEIEVLVDHGYRCQVKHHQFGTWSVSNDELASEYAAEASNVTYHDIALVALRQSSGDVPPTDATPDTQRSPADVSSTHGSAAPDSASFEAIADGGSGGGSGRVCARQARQQRTDSTRGQSFLLCKTPLRLLV
jgi:hypothetical protein